MHIFTGMSKNQKPLVTYQLERIRFHELLDLCDRLDRTRSWISRQAVEEYLDRNREKEPRP